ncbi:MAG TPA: pyruvate dehydrogenase (acetyl-transferring), homodimeric type [Candidatus Rubrimentiphilum sp.]|nr:pyruvate dehydrogenase (acetyl-transferring), homodimeric type [Candidatus Rubrimentiphilum sp.]
MSTTADGVAAATPAAESDPQETREWVEAIEGVLQHEGPARAQELIGAVVEAAQRGGAHVSLGLSTPYINTIPPSEQEPMPGNDELETRIRHYVRWNAMAMVARANKESSELGGHVASFASAATLYDVGFNYFFRAPSQQSGGDLIFLQGHSSPGFYARAFVEGRITAEQLENFRREVDGKGLPSYPHPWLMPDFWQFPTVSMGLGPIMSIYQARFMRYLHDRGIIDAGDRKVWGFLGDGEMDEPESMGAIALAAREKLDNLIWVINCNLQRLDGPVRGNGKIIQELETDFKGAGWNVIKVIWGSNWDPLLERDSTGKLVQLMNECVDGEYQTFKANNGRFVREKFFNRYPETAELVGHMSDDDIWALQRGGHDPRKVYAAYAAAVKHKGQPTVILAKTIKGYGMGESGEAQNIAHQAKKMKVESMRAFRDRFHLPIPDDQVEGLPFFRPAENTPEMKYLRDLVKRRGYIPSRRTKAEALNVPALSAFDAQLKSTGDREISTTMAFVRILSAIVKDKNIGARVVPIVADESRTFGMEGMFRQLGIYSSVGQLYHPQDADQLMWYREDKAGQILQEGINEAGAISSWIAAGTSYSTLAVQMIPFYIFYSMFGFQRVGDLAWAAADSRTRGFLIGGTSGRTTLNGEGLQHEDGHSQVFASFIPNCISYDPTYSYELAVIIRDGLRRMLADQEDIYYYITVMNENYHHPEMPKGAESGILKGMYLLRERGEGKNGRVQLLGSGAILREVEAAAELLSADFDVGSDVWSVTSFNELRRDGIAAERWNLVHPEQPSRLPYVAQCLKERKGPVIASTDYIRTFADQIRPYIARPYVTLGTDGFGRSDFRRKLREFFEVNRHYVAVAALKALADSGTIKRSVVTEAIKKYGIDPSKPNPVNV